jgi:hypothetical protein
MNKLSDKLYFLLLFLSYAVGIIPSQTLLRRSPPALQPQSCRDHMRDQRKVFMRTAVTAGSVQETRDLATLAMDLDDPKTVAWICSHPREIHNIDLLASLAEYARRVRLATK